MRKVILLTILVLISGCSSKVENIELSKSLTHKVVGYSGYGELVYKIDEDKIREQLIHSDEETKNGQTFKDFVDSIDLEFDKDNYTLSNGEEITVSLTFDEELAKKSNINVTNNKEVINVENLKVLRNGNSPFIIDEYEGENFDKYLFERITHLDKDGYLDKHVGEFFTAWTLFGHDLAGSDTLENIDMMRSQSMSKVYGVEPSLIMSIVEKIQNLNPTKRDVGKTYQDLAFQDVTSEDDLLKIAYEYLLTIDKYKEMRITKSRATISSGYNGTPYDHNGVEYLIPISVEFEGVDKYSKKREVTVVYGFIDYNSYSERKDPELLSIFEIDGYYGGYQPNIVMEFENQTDYPYILYRLTVKQRGK